MLTMGLIKLAFMKGQSRLLYFSVSFINFIVYIRLILLFSGSGINQALAILFFFLTFRPSNLAIEDSIICIHLITALTAL